MQWEPPSQPSCVDPTAARLALPVLGKNASVPMTAHVGTTPQNTQAVFDISEALLRMQDLEAGNRAPGSNSSDSPLSSPEDEKKQILAMV